MNSKKSFVILLFLIVLVAFAGWHFRSSLLPSAANKRVKTAQAKAIPVEVATIRIAPIEQRRTFSGTLEPQAEFIVAPKISGRIKRMLVDLADTVQRGQLVGELDSDEYLQAVTQAEADLAVAKANLTSTVNALATAERDLLRITTLNKRGVASEAQFDSAKANQLAKQGEKEVAEAQLLRAQSQLATVKIRLGYTRITADWSDGAEQRVVAERFVDEGDTVSANSPLLRIVELAPITGVIYIAERDYGLLQPGLAVTLTTDVFPGVSFTGRINRIAPAFKTTTRQARVELLIENRDHRLKPGIFIRATIVLARHERATIVPREALTKRGDAVGLFLLDEQHQSAKWQEIQTGLEDDQHVEITSPQISGKVITLGQQQLSDGAQVLVSSSATQ
jgi:RND family efflux transporter MFP subunit